MTEPKVWVCGGDSGRVGCGAEYTEAEYRDLGTSGPTEDVTCECGGVDIVRIKVVDSAPT